MTVDELEKALEHANERIAQLETEKRVASDLLWACPLPEMRAFVHFFGRIAQGPHIAQAEAIRGWAKDVELMR